MIVARDNHPMLVITQEKKFLEDLTGGGRHGIICTLAWCSHGQPHDLTANQ
jgi:hypothetical protein